MSKSLSDLAMQLREIHAILVGCGAKVVIDEAADKLEELQAELIARDRHDDSFVARINELLTDKQRLDWWERQHTLRYSLCLTYIVDGYLLQELKDGGQVMSEYSSSSMRKCIDAAMQIMS